jgi:FtsP/CotA-like multicopper oxidase with cupredoxin domain
VPSSYLGPTIRLQKGQKVRLNFRNSLPERSIIHWHGLHVPEDMDGHPRFAVDPGQTFVYEYEIRDRAGTYWYHPHPHERTGPQVYNGLAGVLIATDQEEAKAGLPSGSYDVPLVIQDRLFDDRDQLVYEGNGMMNRMMGHLGNRIFVNGHPEFTLKADTATYRLRLLNGSNSRIYKLAWSDATPMTVIATDGGLLEKPVTRTYVTLGPAERVEILADFSRRQVGSEIRMLSLEFSGAGAAGGSGGMGGMMGGMDGGGRLSNGAQFTVFTVHMERDAKRPFELPAKLSMPPRYRGEDAVNHRNPRVIPFGMRGMMNWTLNGRTFKMREVADNEVVDANSLEVWELVNESGSMGMTGMGGMVGMAMAHPIHIHGAHFQVIDRNVSREFQAAWETVREGFVDEGWKDTVLVMPGERVRVLVKFEDYSGLYLYHCHILEHEDQGMMRNYRVRAV